MTNYRIFLLSFVTVSWVFLSGLGKPVDNDMSAMENQKTAVELKSVETENTRKLLETKLETKQLQAKSNVKSVKANPQKTKQTIIKATDAGVAGENNSIKRNEFEKPLDLSIQFDDAENADLKIEQKPAAQNGATNIFTPETKKKPRPLELNGGLLMSPEPEAEKRKSVDGAGIVINLKP
jgi:hypothetical protein